MKKYFQLLMAASIALLAVNRSSAQVLLKADGPGNTYELINSVLAPISGDVVEHPECAHPEFGRHIVEVWDAALGRYVFEFYAHVTPDNDRCIYFDRQRMEIKTYDQSPANMKGVMGETITYKWKFRLPVGFQPSPNFTHIHQIKAVGGNDGDPIFTLTVRKGSPNKIELKHDNTTVVALVNQSLFAGTWVECTEVIYVDSLHGTYSMIIKKVSDGTTILSYTNNNLMTIRSDNTFIRPKWGIYRSLLSSSDLRDDTIRFNSFYISEGTTLPNAPSSFSASVASETTNALNWTDNSDNEETFRIERSTNGSVWSVVTITDPNSAAYVDTVVNTDVPYFYRVRAENTFGNSPYSNIVSSIPGNIMSVSSGNWNNASTWNDGSVPTGSDNVEIGENDTVTIDIDGAVCNDLTVGGILTFPNVNARSITINGDLTVGAAGDFNTFQTGNPTGVLMHTINVRKNLFVTSGGIFDMRKGSGSNVAVGTVEFSGSTNSSISLNRTAYESGSEEFNSVTINKSSGAKVILATGNLFMSNNNSTGPSVLSLTNGMIETGNNVWVHLSTASGGVVNGSVTSYINGALGRGGNTTAGVSRTFEVGDANGYRLAVVTTNAGITSGGYLVVRCIPGNADNSSTLLNGIDKVSGLRYYEIMYEQGTGSSAGTGITKSSLSYASGDGVVDGSTALRIAYSTNNRAAWSGVMQSNTHIASVSSTPVTITPDTFATAISLADGTGFYVALANATGGGNTLPVELSRFSATTRHTNAELVWHTAVETNSVGFDIERKKLVEGKDERWESIGFVRSHGTSNAPHEYSFIDRTFGGGIVLYRLRMIDKDGTSSYSSEVSVSIGSAPSMLSLSDNYPNPFNPATAIEFTVPGSGTAVLSVYNPLGQKMTEIYNGDVEAGKIYYTIFDASRFNSGIYFYQLQYNGSRIVKKLMLLK